MIGGMSNIILSCTDKWKVYMLLDGMGSLCLPRLDCQYINLSVYID